MNRTRQTAVATSLELEDLEAQFSISGKGEDQEVILERLVLVGHHVPPHLKGVDFKKLLSPLEVQTLELEASIQDHRETAEALADFRASYAEEQA